MIITKQEKNKTTIVLERRLKKAELQKAVGYLNMLTKPGKKIVPAAKIKAIADEVTKSAWEKLKAKRGFKW
jgi:replicative DNA helicase